MSRSDIRIDLSRFEALCLLPGLAGHEGPVSDYMRNQLAPRVDDVRTDVLGNLITTIHGTDPDAPKVMTFAHMDSLGFVVRKIDDDGFVRLHRLGGIPEKVLPASHVTFMTEPEPVHGVIATKAHHVASAEDKARVVPIGDTYVDVGTRDRAETRALGIDVGTAVVYRGRFARLGPNRVVGTAIDNRSGCVALLDLAERLVERRPRSTVHLVGSVQEEYNLRGAMPAAHALRPDVAICLDGSPAGDTPDLRGLNEMRLGEGPSVNLHTFHGRGTLNGLIPHPALLRHVEGVAREHDIPLQRNANFGGLTDASYVQLVGDGIATIDVGIPRRYLHSPNELCDLRDLDRLVDLLEVVHHAFGPEFSLER